MCSFSFALLLFIYLFARRLWPNVCECALVAGLCLGVITHLAALRALGRRAVRSAAGHRRDFPDCIRVIRSRTKRNWIELR